MNIVMALVSGLLVGWGASLKKGTDGREELIMNIVIGAIGAYLGNWLLSAAFDSAESGVLTVSAVIASILGATTALVVVNHIRAA